MQSCKGVSCLRDYLSLLIKHACNNLLSHMLLYHCPANKTIENSRLQLQTLSRNYRVSSYIGILGFQLISALYILLVSMASPLGEKARDGKIQAARFFSQALSRLICSSKD